MMIGGQSSRENVSLLAYWRAGVLACWLAGKLANWPGRLFLVGNLQNVMDEGVVSCMNQKVPRPSLVSPRTSSTDTR